MSERNRRAEVGGIFVAALLVCGAAVLAILSVTVSYESAAATVYSWTPTRQSNPFTFELYERIVLLSRVFAAGLLLCGIAVFVWRGPVTRNSANALRSMVDVSRELWTTCSVALAESGRSHGIALGTIVLIGFVARLIYLNQPVRNDEAYTFIEYVFRPFPVILSHYNVPNNHIFHSILARLSMLIFGDDLWVLRLPTFVAGVLTIPAAYAVGRILYSSTTGLFAAAFTAASSPLIEYSANARGYSIFILASLTLIILGTHGLRSRTRAIWALFGFTLAIGFYTVPVTIYPAGAVILWLVVTTALQPSSVEKRAESLNLIYATAFGAALTLVLYLPVIAASGFEALVANRFVVPLTWNEWTGEFADSLIRTWALLTRDIPPALIVVLIVGFALSHIRHRHVSRYRVSIILPIFAWIASLLVVQRVAPFIRIWLFLLPILFAVASAGMIDGVRLLCRKFARIRESTIAPIVAIFTTISLTVVVVQSGTVLTSRETGVFPASRDAAHIVNGLLEPGVLVVATDPIDSPVTYWFIKLGYPIDAVRYPLERIADANRILLLASHDSGLPYVYAAHPWAARFFGEPIRIRDIGDATIYVANRINGSRDID